MRRTIALLTVLLALTAGSGVAYAHTLSAVTAKKAAVKKAAAAGKEAGASSTKVGTCKRSTSHKFVCGARLNYTGGSYCTLKIEVRFKSSTSTRLVSRAFGTLCY
jgi:hypothetical protein